MLLMLCILYFSCDDFPEAVTAPGASTCNWLLPAEWGVSAHHLISNRLTTLVSLLHRDRNM